MTAPKPTPAPKKASGKNIENWQRKTVQILLRLPPDVAASMRDRAAQEEMSLTEYVTRLVRQDLAIV